MIFCKFFNFKVLSCASLLAFFCMGISINGEESLQSKKNQDEQSEIRDDFNSNTSKSVLAGIFNRLDRLGRAVGRKTNAVYQTSVNFLKRNTRRFLKLATYLVLSVLILAPVCVVIATARKEEARRRERKHAGYKSYYYRQYQYGEWNEGEIRPRPEFDSDVYEALGVAPGASPYDILGVERGASKDVVNREYKKKMRRWHPDRNRGNEKFAASVSQLLGQAKDEIIPPGRFKPEGN